MDTALGMFGRRAAELFRNQTSGRRQHRQQQQQPTQPRPHHHQQQQSIRNPPASKRAIRQLPTVVVAPEDLVDPSNRECCICLEENHLRDRVIRLPCAHIFHTRCIVDWLSKSNTCPVCRYELFTDNPEYERTVRLERMKHRKPRYAQYELQRMSIRELQSLSDRLSVSTVGCMEKSDLVMRLLQSNKVDVIVTPPAVEYPLSLLRAMGIGELKRCMADAGVFFDPIDVVEKEDMVQIFVASGRLIVLMEEDAQEDDDDDMTSYKMPATPSETVRQDSNGSVASRKRPAPPSSSDDDDDIEDYDSRVPIVTTVGEDDSDDDDVGGDNVRMGHDRAADSLDRLPRTHPLMEEVLDLDDDYERNASFPSQHDASVANHVNSSSHSLVDEEMMEADTRPHSNVAPSGSDETTASGETIESTRSVNAEAATEEPMESDGNDEAGTEETMETRAIEESSDVPIEEYASGEEEMAEEQDVENVYPVLVGRHASAGTDDTTSQVDESYAASTTTSTADDSQFQQRSISDLQAIAREMHVDISDCIERTEIIDRLVSATGRSDPRLTPNDFSTWSVSELRALAREVNVDFSNCTERITMIAMLIEASNERPRVAEYLSALMPLARLTVPQLRAVAREWQVSLHDCLEKEEMIHRLVLSGGPVSSY